MLKYNHLFYHEGARIAEAPEGAWPQKLRGRRDGVMKGYAKVYSPRAFAAAASTCGTRKGLVRYPATPRLTASIALDSVENPVMMMIGRSALYRFASRMTVRPSMPGILRSAISRS